MPISVSSQSPARSSRAVTALDAASKILPYYNEYFGVKYPLPKLDLIAIPGNFAAGAMENWGGITYIDNDLLFDRDIVGRHQASIFLVVAHEMAHQCRAISSPWPGWTISG